jgi:hypothetical protein
MPVGKKPQTDPMLYYLITFVGLFLVATALAIICYIKIENYRTIAATSKSELEQMATPAEQRKGIGKIVGRVPRDKSGLGIMDDYLDQMVYLIIGGLPEDTSAEVKVETANREVKNTLELLAQQHLGAKNVAPKATTNEFVELLANQQFSAATESFDETMKDALPPEKLEETWKLTISQMGPFKQQIGLRTEKQLGYDIVLITCEFEKGHLDIKVVYNDKKQVAGLFFVPTPPEVLESYQQTPELVTQEQPSIEIYDPNTNGLIRIIQRLNAALGETTTAQTNLKNQLDNLRSRFDDAVAASLEKERTLLAEKEKYEQQIRDIKKDYNDLKTLTQQTADQQVQTLMARLDEEKANSRALKDDLLKTKAQLEVVQERMSLAHEKLTAIVPPPDSEAPAFVPDGKILLVDNQTKVAHLNIGSDDHVYPGLTFSVYDKSFPIPKDGKGKAELEVFDVAKTFSVARIIRSEVKRPIAVDDIVANLIWDSSKTNVFVIVGEFDLNGDENIDYDGIEKIKALVEKWGGKVADNVTVNTDYLILGQAPVVQQKPTSEQMEADPMALERYEASLRNLSHYKNVQTQAQTLSIPVLNAERFFYFIGYKTKATKAGAWSF